MKKIQRLTVLAVMTLIPGAANPQNHAKQHPAEQLNFSAEDEGVTNPVRLPADILSLLKNDELVKTALANADPPTNQIPASWFSTSLVHLGGPEETGYVVVGEQALVGANVSPFWIFISSSAGVRCVLFTGGHDLRITPGRHYGHKDIQTFSVTMQRVNSSRFYFNGKQYRLRKSSSDKIR